MHLPHHDNVLRIVGRCGAGDGGSVCAAARPGGRDVPQR